MGLEERKAVDQFQKEHFCQIEQNIQDEFGSKIELEVDWKSISAQGLYSNSFDNWQKVYFQPVIHALKAVKVDNLAIEALKTKITKLKFCCSGNKFCAMPDYKNGILTVDDRVVNVDSLNDRAQKIQQKLEIVIEARTSESPEDKVAKSIQRLPAASIKNILMVLYHLKKRSFKEPSISIPKITLYLHSGAIHGLLMDYDLKNSLLMFDQRAMELSYIDTHSIYNITIHLDHIFDKNLHVVDRGNFLKAKGEVIKSLSFSKIKMNPAIIPGRLTVKRQALKFEETLTKKLEKNVNIIFPWPDLPDTDDATISISLLISTLEEMLFKIIDEELGLAAIKEKIENIKFQITDKTDAILEGSTFIIYLAKDENNIQYLSKDALGKKINDLL